MTSVDDEMLATQAVQQGAQDYLVKGQVTPHLLSRTLIYAVERKRLEQALRESQNEIATILASAPVVIMVVDEERRILEANTAAAKFAGHRPEEMLNLRAGEALRCLNSLDDSQGCGFGPHCETCKTRLTLQDTFETGKSHYQVEWHIPVTENGKTREVYFLLSTVPLATSTKQVLVCIEDISKLKSVEEQLIAYERLATIGKVSGSIAHEIRNPLAVIDSSIFYLEKILPTADERVKTHLNRIMSATHRCAVVIEALLKLTHPEELRLGSVDLKKLVDTLLAEDCPPGVQTVKNYTAGDVAVRGDEAQLSIALRNIVTNAVQAMNGAGTLTVVIKTYDDSVEITFSDTGPGITPENMSKIFEPLFTTKAKGIGLGLSIAKAIIELHQGTVSVASTPGTGATLTIRLPNFQAPQP